MKRLVCPYCNESVELDITNAVNECPHCGKIVDSTVAIKNTQAYLNNIYKAAYQYFESAYSFEEAYRYFKEFLRYEPTHLDAILMKLLSLFRCSSLKKNVFNQLIEEFNSAEIVLEKTTYIRIGHFFEELLGSMFLYQKRIIDFIEMASPLEAEIAYNNIVDLLGFYDFVFENLELFTEEEYKDSIFISKEEISLNKEKLITFMRNSNNLSFDLKSLGSAEIFVNNKKIIHSEFDINNYEEVTDFALFDLMEGGLKANYLTFVLLILLTIGVIVGLVLALVLPDIQWVGWTILGVCAAADVGVYIFFTKKRAKKLATLNKQ